MHGRASDFYPTLNRLLRTRDRPQALWRVPSPVGASERCAERRKPVLLIDYAPWGMATLSVFAPTQNRTHGNPGPKPSFLSASLPGCLAASYALGSARSGFETTPTGMPELPHKIP